MNDAEKMKKMIKKSLAFVLVLIMAVSVLGVVPVFAEEVEDTQYSYTPYSWHRVVKDKTKVFEAEDGDGIIANCFYERIELVGFKKGVKKINKYLKKLSKAYSCDSLYNYASEDVAYGRTGDVYSDYVVSDVTYADQNFISVVTTREWYAGGVGNHYTDGYVFDLDTGKKLSITKVTGLSAKELRKQFVVMLKKYLGEEASYYGDDVLEAFVNGIEISDINFGIDGDGKIVILIPPYTEPFYGGWTREIVLEDLPPVYERG